VRARRRQAWEAEAEINLTPMLDVLFIMLIFFVVTTSFIREAGIEISRPAAATAERREQGNIVIAIGADGDVWIDRRRVDVGAVRANIERLHAESPNADLIVQADRFSRNGILVKVLDAARLAGIEGVALAAEPEGE
jgi:biopolymer transport protein ExbD